MFESEFRKKKTPKKQKKTKNDIHHSFIPQSQPFALFTGIYNLLIFFFIWLFSDSSQPISTKLSKVGDYDKKLLQGVFCVDVS